MTRYLTLAALVILAALVLAFMAACTELEALAPDLCADDVRGAVDSSEEIETAADVLCEVAK